MKDPTLLVKERQRKKIADATKKAVGKKKSLSHKSASKKWQVARGVRGSSCTM